MSTSVFIVDDHNIIIQGIQSMLEAVPDVTVLGSADSGQDLLDKLNAAETKPDIVLMDIKMPGKNGIETTREVLGQWPDIRVIALTMFDDDEYITTMLSAGAKGYILKNTGKDDLIRAIQEVAQGRSYFSSEATAKVMARFMQGQVPGSGQLSGGAKSDNGVATSNINTNVQLTRREIEILKLIASEMTNQEIADKLFISPRTVHSHRRNLMQKVGVKNTAGLVRYAIETKIL